MFLKRQNYGNGDEWLPGVKKELEQEGSGYNCEWATRRIPVVMDCMNVTILLVIILYFCKIFPLGETG